MTLSHVAVLIPARNEQDLLPRCLNSVLEACAALPAAVTWDVVVAVDSSVDRTHQIARSMLGRRGKAIRLEAGCVGEARICAARSALLRYDGPRESCWLANTDADCVIPGRWLADQVELANAGVEAIAGVVDVDSFLEHLPGVADRFRTSYLIAPDGSHPHVHGANLGVRADAYLRAGGWSGLSTAEDHDLWGRLVKGGARAVSVAGISVVTSGRRVGRAPNGFAGALAAHNEGLFADELLVLPA